ncbi:MAG: FtsQ-type POTRA domain-containing protein [Candidatus Eisenbacteria bacterium]|uniref:FtsQ-type POTRA domain-containing protein n=1 Tax=Eiseniibacteriota bacterium TaxID=2212470 RepID=A0A937X7H4_UNCEI|nr:FtsQ-type POTRA domain-containing protein [Candidatus Eisenbacteria bacterium]
MSARDERSRGGRGARWAAALLLLAAVGAAVAAAALPRRLHAGAPIETLEIRIAGPGHLDVQEVRRALGVPPGTPIGAVDPDSACRRLRLALPRVVEARWREGWFERPALEVVERNPVCMIAGPEGRVLEAAEDGILLAPRGEALADLPLLTWAPGAQAALCTAGALLDLPGAPDLLGLLARLRGGHPSLWADLSEARLHPDGGYELFWSDQPTVTRGRGALSAARLQAWSAVLADLRERDERDAVIDLRFKDRIIVSLPESERPPRQARGVVPPPGAAPAGPRPASAAGAPAESQRG